MLFSFWSLYKTYDLRCGPITNNFAFHLSSFFIRPDQCPLYRREAQNPSIHHLLCTITNKQDSERPELLSLRCSHPTQRGKVHLFLVDNCVLSGADLHPSCFTLGSEPPQLSLKVMGLSAMVDLKRQSGFCATKASWASRALSWCGLKPARTGW